MIRTIFLLLIWLSIPGYPLSAQRIYVKAGSNGNGSSWGQASGNLRDALLTAVAGTEIWVAGGSYYPVNCTNCTAADRNLFFEVRDQIKLYGGFTGTETQLDQRDWLANPTILSGDIDLDGSQANNSHTILYTHNVSEETIIDGFYIQQANAEDTTANFGAPGNTGGGWYNDGSQAGSISNPVVRNCTFRWNDAVVFGGGVYNDGCFEGEGNPLLINCTFELNNSLQGGGGMYNNGSFQGNCSPVYINCRFLSNQTQNSGGGIFNNGLSGNSSPVITNSTFYDNDSEFYGGSIYNLGKEGISSPEITNCLFDSNRGTAAGGIYNLGSENGNSSPVVTNCTFYGNRAEVGASIYNQAGDSTGNCSAQVTNSIFYGNISNSGFGYVFQNVYGTPSISYCLVQVNDCSELNTGLNGSTDCGDGLIFNQDPMLVDPANGDFHLLDTSLLIDLGDNAAINATGIVIDLDSLARIANGRVDLGVYEFQPPVYEPLVIVQQPAGQSICEGTGVQLEVRASGSGPISYQWYKEGAELNGATDSILVLNNALTGDAGNYRCRLTGPALDTLWSDEAGLEVNPILPVSLDIAASTAESCAGDTVMFTAHPLNGGPAPAFQWKLNGLNTGVSGPMFSLDTLESQDRISCYLISSEACPSNDTAFSDTLSVLVSPLLEAEIIIESLSDSLPCQGDTLTFVANVQNQGMQPVYRWLINGTEVSANAPVFMTDILNDGDQLVCILESSEPCILNRQVSSNQLTIAMEDCTSSSPELEHSPRISVFPNPAGRQLTLRVEQQMEDVRLILTDLNGSAVFNFDYGPVPGGMVRTIDVSELPEGTYLLYFISGKEQFVKRIVLVNP